MSATSKNGKKRTGVVSKSVLQRERRQLRRHMAALIVSAMSASDLDFKAMKKRCGRNANTIRRLLHCLIDGKEIPMELEYISDILLSMGYEPTINVRTLSEYAK